MPRLVLGLVAAAPMLLAAPSAMANSPCVSECNFVADPSTCQFVVSGGCTAQCTPITVAAECDGMCNASATADCTGSCSASCMSQCMASPGSFSCSGQCSTSCKASCMSSCSDAACQTACEGDCDNRCEVECEATPPSASCDAQCKASCQGSCTVQANVNCQAMCTASVQGGCQADCEAPQGALFCGDPPQYVSVTSAASCYSCLLTNGLTANASLSCSGGHCTGGASICTASRAGFSDERWGVFGITSLMVGLGLVASRRRRRA